MPQKSTYFYPKLTTGLVMNKILTDQRRKTMLARECKKELTEHIIPFWNSLEDNDNGGFYGYVGNDLTLDKNAPKGVILHSRILWFYSNCYLVLKDQNCLKKLSTLMNSFRNTVLTRKTAVYTG